MHFAPQFGGNLLQPIPQQNYLVAPPIVRIEGNDSGKFCMSNGSRASNQANHSRSSKKKSSSSGGQSPAAPGQGSDQVLNNNPAWQLERNPNQNNYSINVNNNFFLEGVSDPNQRQMIQNVENRINQTGVRQIQENMENLRRNTNNIGAFFRARNSNQNGAVVPVVETPFSQEQNQISSPVNDEEEKQIPQESESLKRHKVSSIHGIAEQSKLDSLKNGYKLSVNQIEGVLKQSDDKLSNKLIFQALGEDSSQDLLDKSDSEKMKKLHKQKEPLLHFVMKENSRQNELLRKSLEKRFSALSVQSSQKSDANANSLSPNNAQQQKQNSSSDSKELELPITRQGKFKQQLKQLEQNFSPISQRKSESVSVSAPDANSVVQASSLISPVNGNRDQTQMSQIQQEVNKIRKNIESINDTLYVCYVASKYGLEYKNLISQSGDQERVEGSSQESEEEKKEEDESYELVPRSKKKQKTLNDQSKVPIKFKKINRNSSMILGDKNGEEAKDGKIKLSKDAKSMLSQQISPNNNQFQRLQKFIPPKEVYKKLPNTRRKIARGHIGPRLINNYDRQIINQFNLRVDQQNQENQKRVLMVNNHIHNLLRGVNAPESIQEEENEQSKSISYSMGLDMHYLQNRGHQSGLPEMTMRSSMINGDQQHQVKRANIRMTNTSSMFGGSLQPSQQDSRLQAYRNGLSQIDGRSEKSYRSSLRSMSRPSSSSSSKRPIIIINNKEQDISIEKLNEIIKRYKKSGNIDILNFSQRDNGEYNLDQHQIIEQLDQESQSNSSKKDFMPKQFQRSNSLDNSSPSNSSLNEIPRIRSSKDSKQLRGLKNKIQSGVIKPLDPLQNDPQQKVYIQNENSRDDGSQCGFQSVRVLKQKISQNRIDQVRQTASGKISPIDHFFQDDKKQQPMGSTKKIIENINLPKVDEEEKEQNSIQTYQINLSSGSVSQFKSLKNNNTSSNTTLQNSILSGKRQVEGQEESKQIIEDQNESQSQKIDPEQIKIEIPNDNLTKINEVDELSPEEYSGRTLRLLKKCVSYMTPIYHNKIRRNLINLDQHEKQKQVFQAMSRMAFERNPDLQISATLLDYNSLKAYSGAIVFSEGCQKIFFKGKKAQKEQRRTKAKSASCFSGIKKKLFGNFMDLGEFEILKLEEKFDTKSILGIVTGPNNVTFRQYCNLQVLNKQFNQNKFDQWRFVTVLTTMRSYDFMFDKRQDALDLIVSVYEAIGKQQTIEHNQIMHKLQAQKQAISPQKTQVHGIKNIKQQLKQNIENQINAKKIELIQRQIKKEETSFQVKAKLIESKTNHRLLMFKLTRAKIIAIAEDKGYTMSQYFMTAIYFSVLDLTEDTVQQRESKLDKIKVIFEICEKNFQLKQLLQNFSQEKSQRELIKNVLKDKLQSEDQSEKDETLQQYMKLTTFGTSKKNSLKILKKVTEKTKRLSLSSIFEDDDSNNSSRVEEVKTPVSLHTQATEQPQKQLTQINSLSKNFTLNNSKLKKKESIKESDDDSQWQKWLKKGNESGGHEQRKIIALKKIRSINFLQHLRRKKQSDPNLKFLSDWLKDIKQDVSTQKHDVSAKDLIQQKRNIVKWTKQTYTIANRFGDMNYQEMLRTLQGGQREHLSITENKMKLLKDEDQERILERQQIINKDISSIIKLQDEAPSDFLDVIRHAKFTRDKDKQYEQILQQEEEILQTMPVKQLLDLKARLAKRAQSEWQYEYKRQKNFLRKHISLNVQMG